MIYVHTIGTIALLHLKQGSEMRGNGKVWSNWYRVSDEKVQEIATM